MPKLLIAIQNDELKSTLKLIMTSRNSLIAIFKEIRSRDKTNEGDDFIKHSEIKESRI